MEVAPTAPIGSANGSTNRSTSRTLEHAGYAGHGASSPGPDRQHNDGSGVLAPMGQIQINPGMQDELQWSGHLPAQALGVSLGMLGWFYGNRGYFHEDYGPFR